jgi:hypothetical protein
MTRPPGQRIKKRVIKTLILEEIQQKKKNYQSPHLPAAGR